MKKNILKNNQGITLLTLVITIIVLLILTAVSIDIGKNTIKDAKLQNMKTNMLLIEAKVKEYVENANYELGVKPDEATEEMQTKANSMLEGEGKGTKITSSDSLYSDLSAIGVEQEAIDNGTVYKISTEDLSKMGISGVESDDEEGWYIVAYNITNSSAKIYNTTGIKSEDDTIKYCLDDIRDL